jgi:hypothetical protein
MTQVTLIDTLGWIGAITVLLAYALVSLGKLTGDAIPYQLLNLTGAGLLLLNSFYYGALPSVGVNVVWISIAVLAIVKGLTGTRSRNSRWQRD